MTIRSLGTGPWREYGAAVLMYCATFPALATVVYSGGAPDQRNGYFWDRFSRYSETDMAFVVRSSAPTIAGIQWSGNYANASGGVRGADDLAVNIRRDLEGLPDTIAVEKITVGNATPAITGKQHVGFNGTFPEYTYAASFSPISLTPGVTYWLGINNGLGDGTAWAWETTSGTREPALYRQVDTAWTIQSDKLAFQLSDDTAPTVLDPNSFALLSLGFVGLAFIKTKLKQLHWGCSFDTARSDPTTLPSPSQRS